jgi:hypothetical protein
MWQNVQMAEEGTLPPELLPKVLGPNCTWNRQLMLETLDSIVELLRRNVASSWTVLMIAFPQQAELWQQEVHQQLKNALEQPEEPRFCTPDRGIAATSGVLFYLPLLQDMVAAIDQLESDQGIATEDLDVSQVMELSGEQMIQSLCSDLPCTIARYLPSVTR